MTASAELRAAARRVRTAPERVVAAGAEAMRTALEEQAARDTGGDRVLSGAAGGRGRRTRLSATVRVTGGTALATATVSAAPARRGVTQWGWLERGTGPRVIGRLPRKRGRGGKHLNAGGGWFTGPVNAGSSPAKRTWTRGAEHGRRPAQAAMDDEFARILGAG